MHNFSVLESRNLEAAIRTKINEIRHLKSIIESKNLKVIQLPIKDEMNLKKHFEKKLEFYRLQDRNKWKSWPIKSNNILRKVQEQGRTTRNYKRKHHNQQRRTERDAKRAILNHSVVVLVDMDIPLGAIALLGKGLGFVPTPKVDKLKLRLDMKLLSDKVITQSNRNIAKKNTPFLQDESFEPVPKKLRQPRYTTKASTTDRVVNETVERMRTELDIKLQHDEPEKPSNLSKDELKGLKWLERQVSDGKIAVTKADKGGATIIVDPDVLRKRSVDKLSDPSLYKKLDHDPTKALHKELVNLWIDGKTRGLIPAKTAKSIMGISNELKADKSGPTNAQSTLPHFKPGKPYFYPCLKIHKLKKVDLKPGVEPPARLITALQEGVTRRSDVYLADTFLRSLEREFCGDLLIDSGDALNWLDGINSSFDHNTKRRLRSFAFDYKALYDSLKPDLAMEALTVAMTECRTEWSEEFKQWILALVDLSFRASIGQFEGDWYQQLVGIPTGGSLCVQIANIAVYYYMRKVVYSDEHLMKNVSTVKRYIDDGAGFFDGTKRQFSEFISNVNSRLGSVGLNIDEFSIEDPGGFTCFLDIQFTFDVDGNLQTDLYVKETDSRSYLYFGSTHPNHVYSSIIYSQCLRLRRIINDNDRLALRIDELNECFSNSNYPKKMINNISSKVKTFERRLPTCRDTSNSSILLPVSPDNTIRVISTFGSDVALIDIIEKFESTIETSPSLSSTSNTDTTSTTETSNNERNTGKRLFSYVKRSGASLRRRLLNPQLHAENNTLTKTEPCHQRNCKCCSMIGSEKSYCINGVKIRQAPGTCSSYNIVYIFICKLCPSPFCYVGRTIRTLHERVTEHRANYYKLLKDPSLKLSDDFLSDDSDTYSLAAHLIDSHNLSNRPDFDASYNVFILKNSSPSNLEVNEHLLIQKLRTLKPYGINSCDPFGMPLLFENKTFDNGP